jgi:hypothetical protein
MDKDLLVHKKFVQSEIARLKKEPNREAAITLLNYHDIQTRNFQHERQIHLYVTFFFALLMFGSWVASLGVFLALGCFDIAMWPLLLLTLILTVLEGFYIRYYYHLENRTQKLYALTDEIYKLTK